MDITTSSPYRAISSVIIAVLLAVTASFAQTYTNPYDPLYQQLTAQWDKSNAPAKAVLLDRIYRMREFVTDSGIVGKKLTAIAEDWDEPVLVRDQANWHRAQIALHEGRFDEARRLTDALGFVRDWTLTRSPKCLPLNTADTSTVRPSPLGLATLHASGGSVCVATAIYSSKAQNVGLRLGTNAPVAVFVNSTPLESYIDVKGCAFDQRSVGVALRQGWNIVALQLDSTVDTKQFALRISAPEGSGIPLTADSSRINATIRSTAKAPIADLLKFAERISSSASALETTASLREIRGLGSDPERLEMAAKTAPTADRWLAVAKVCSQQNCAFNALTRALQIDPIHNAAKMELARYYLERGQAEKSRGLLLQVLAAQPRDFVARKFLAETYFSSGSAPLGIEELKQLQSNGPNPIWLKREMALRYAAEGMNGPAASLLSQVWKTTLDDSRIRTALQALAEKRGDDDMLRMLAQVSELLNPMDPQAKLHLAHAESANEAIFAADAQLSNLDLLAIAEPASTPRRRLINAVKCDPVVNHLQTETQSDAEFLIDAAKLASEERRNTTRESANVITLADINVERLRANGQSTIHAQQVFFINNERGARDYAARSIQYSHATQRLTELSARLHKADGRVLEAEDQGETSVADTSVSMYYDTRARLLRFPGLEKGDTIELEYRISPNSTVNPYGNYFGTLVAFRNGLPQRFRRFVVVAPPNLKLNIVEQRMPIQAVVTQNGEQTTYRWDVSNISPLMTEPRGPSLTEVAPYVTVSTFAGWNELGRWYAGLITPQFSLDGELRDVLAQITATTKTEQENIRAIHEFVLRNTHYLAMEFGIYSYKPYAVTQTYARRFGDCKDKASLMIAMMREAGIDAEFALVRTRKLGDVSDRASNIAVFNHAVVYIPKYDLWLDGTAEYAGSRELPLDDQGAMALTVNLNGNATLRRIPVTLPMQNYTHRVVRAEVRKDGNILFRGSAYTRGEDAPGLRREYEIADRQRDTVRANLAQVYPSVQVDSVMVDGAHDIERDIHVKFSGSLNKFAGQTRLALVSSWLPHQYVNLLASLASRTQQLQLPAPWTTEEEIHFVVPDGASVESLPGNVRLETPFGTAVIRYVRRGSKIVVNTSVQFSKLRIEPEEYSQFRQFCADVEKAFRKEIKVRL